ncbi:MAG: transposase [Frankiaceae bacterium]
MRRRSVGRPGRDRGQAEGAQGRTPRRRHAGRGATLMALFGMGLTSAARVLVDVSDVAQFPDEAHFAAWNGTAPLGASCGRSTTTAPPGPGTGRSATCCTSWPSSNSDTTRPDGPTTGVCSPGARPRWKPCASSTPALRRGLPAAALRPHAHAASGRAAGPEGPSVRT